MAGNEIQSRKGRVLSSVRLPWRRQSPVRLEQRYTPTGIVLQPSPAVALQWWEQAGELPVEMQPAAAYLGQLLLEGRAQLEGGGVALSWDTIYALRSEPEHAGSIELLGLPEQGDWVPRIETRGTPAEAGFVVAIAGWHSPTVGGQEPARHGAVLGEGADARLMSEAAWQTTQAVERFAAEAVPLTAEMRLHRLGVIRALAVRAGAWLDDYLAKTHIVASRKLELELQRYEALGEPVVEVRPQPEGAPPEFLDLFDRYSSTKAKYDIVQPNGGLVHVVPSPAVAAALSVIKTMPGRRLASDEARLFGHNPFAILGDDAREALDEDALIEARQMAGLLPYRLGFDPSRAPPTIVLTPLAAAAESTEVEMTPPLARRLLELSGVSRAKRLPLFRWNGHDIELDATTERALGQLGAWAADASLDSVRLSYAEVLNLDAYSERVVGFEGTVQAVPYVAKRDSEAGWVPDNVVAGVALADRETGRQQNLAMPPEAVAELLHRIEAAAESGAEEVQLPGSETRLPVAQARHLAERLAEAQVSVGQKRAPTPASDPKNEGKRASLQILHNIEQLDYAVEAVTSLGNTVTRAPELPGALRPEIQLLPHQQEGLAWLQDRYELQSAGVSGCLLADDMGLGKTLQSLCLIAWHSERAEAPKPCLVVAPVSLLENWKAEIGKFLDWDSHDVLSLYGGTVSELRQGATSLDAELMQAGIRKLLRPGFEAGYRIVLTTYETLRDYEFSLARVAWGIVLCDEAQKIKNPAAFVTQAAKALWADFRIACTGTPVENSLADLWCLFDFFQPGCLGALNEFTKQYRQAIETRAEGHEVLVEQLRTITHPWVLRRMKNEVAKHGLPEKLETERADPTSAALPMSPMQARLYSDAVAAFRRAQESNEGGAQILSLLARLRMICAHPLAVASTQHETAPLKDHLQASAKLVWLLKRLQAIRRAGEKAIVFTEFRDVQRMIQRAVREQFGYSAQIINGGTTVDSRSEDSRQRVIDRFQAEPGFGVIILSTTAVGFGVNIQAANHVIHFTRPWNPAKEDQATDRAYRIGQTKDVYVYCPTVVGEGYESFEQRLAALLKSKRDLSRDMLAGTQEITAQDFVDL